MIRKAFIVVLALAAICVIAASSVGSPYPLRLWNIDAKRSIGPRFTPHHFNAIYITIGDPTKSDIRFGMMGLGFMRSRMYSDPGGAYSQTMYAVFCPTWLLVVLLGSYPALAFARGPFRRWRRRRRGGCLKCGYDLRGNVSGVCPECGSSIGCGAPPIHPTPAESGSETPA